MKKIKFKKNKKLLVILVLLISIGYALLSANISILGTTKIKNAKWNIYLDNIRITDGSVNATDEANINENKNAVNYNINLNTPGDFYEFLVDAKNDGTIDAMIDNISSQIKINNQNYTDISSITLPNYLNYKVTYENNNQILQKQELNAGEKHTYKVRIEYRKDIDITDLPETEENISFSFGINYIQKDSSSIKNLSLNTGDYISFSSTKKYYNIPKENTGYEFDQSINPNELNLWRIINHKEDGTYEAISEYTSSNNISFKGIEGYSNYVSTLKDIANQYNNPKYTQDSRIFGYNNQTLTLEDKTAFEGSKDTLPYDKSTIMIYDGNGQEYGNGVFGDNLYINDYKNVKNAYNNSLISYKVNNTNEKSTYCVSSRIYKKTNNYVFSFGNFIINSNGNIDNNNELRKYENYWQNVTSNCSIRPIITLRNDISINEGSGTKNNPYTFA